MKYMQDKAEPDNANADALHVNVRIVFLFESEIMPRTIGVYTVSAFREDVHKTFFNGHNLWIL